MSRKIVITGPSSSGKSTLCDLLKKEYCLNVMGETAREVLQELEYDPKLAQNIMMYEQIRKERSIVGDDIHILDRAIPDYIAFSEYLMTALDPKLVRTGRIMARGYEKVFVLNPVNNFKSDGVRIESGRVQTEAMFEKVLQYYNRMGYHPVVINSTTPEERAEELLKYIL